MTESDASLEAAKHDEFDHLEQNDDRVDNQVIVESDGAVLSVFSGVWLPEQGNASLNTREEVERRS